MLLREDATEERLNGRYYTPEVLSDYIVNWATQNRLNGTVLEPSCGDGIFLKSFRNLGIDDRFSINAVELDRNESLLAFNRIENSTFLQNVDELEGNLNILIDQGCRVINEDFYRVYERIANEEQFDIIVGNPPYIRYQYLTEEQREEQSIILRNNGMRPNKLINAWVSFVVACVQMLNENGRIGLVIPAELMQVGYAEQLRIFLMQQLQMTTVVTFRELVFPNVEQEVVLLLGEKNADHIDEHQLRIVQYDNILELVNDEGLNDIQFNDVEINDAKWTRYFLNEEYNQLINTIRQNENFIRFGDIANVDIGITTGNNNYFCVNRDIAEEYDLIDICEPLIARSVNINGIEFTDDDWQENIDRGARTYLVNYPDIPIEEYTEGQRNYIELGEREGENKGYKCRIRQRWYRVPSIWSPDAFLLRRNHLYPKLMLNTDINAVSTDTMHRIRFNEGIDRRRVILSYYNSISFAFTEIEGRSYGGGVLEILPGEFERVTIPDLMNTDVLTDDIIDDVISDIDRCIRENRDISEVLDIVDTRILIGLLDVGEEVLHQFRDIWNILRNRRLNRRRARTI